MSDSRTRSFTNSSRKVHSGSAQVSAMLPIFCPTHSALSAIGLLTIWPRGFSKHLTIGFRRVNMKLPIHGDDIGYVKLLDVMGNEWTPADDARTSTDKGNLGPEKDSAL